MLVLWVYDLTRKKRNRKLFQEKAISSASGPWNCSNLCHCGHYSLLWRSFLAAVGRWTWEHIFNWIKYTSWSPRSENTVSVFQSDMGFWVFISGGQNTQSSRMKDLFHLDRDLRNPSRSIWAILSGHSSLANITGRPGKGPLSTAQPPSEMGLLFASSWISMSSNHMRRSQNILQRPNCKLALKTWPKEHMIQTLGLRLALCLSPKEGWKKPWLKPLEDQEERLEQECRSFHYCHCQLGWPVIWKSKWTVCFTKQSTREKSPMPQNMEAAS